MGNLRRIKLIPIDRTHSPAVFHLLADKSLYKFTGGEPPRNVVAVEQWLTALESRLSPDKSERWLTWVVQLIETSTSIGYVQATVISSEADLAWLIGADWQGQGYASEAAVELMAWINGQEIAEVSANIHPENSASQRIAEKIGMIPTGRTVNGEEVWRRLLATK